jgi:hypothetical protein
VGQQQILFLILTVCIIGIAVSVGVIKAQQGDLDDRRDVVIEELERLASKGQDYYKRPLQEGGGDGSFLRLTARPGGITSLMDASSSKYGDFFVKMSSASSPLQLIGVGLDRGLDPRYPVKIMMTVLPESTAVTILN